MSAQFLRVRSRLCRKRGRWTKGEIKYDKAASGTRRCVAMPVKRPILVHFVTHPLSEPWNLVVFLRQSFDRHMNAYPCRDACRSRPHALRKGKGGWMQFYMSSLPYPISPFVKRPLTRSGVIQGVGNNSPLLHPTCLSAVPEVSPLTGAILRDRPR